MLKWCRPNFNLETIPNSKRRITNPPTPKLPANDFSSFQYNTADLRSKTQQQASHRIRPTSSQFMHLRATNSAVKWFLCRLFFDPLQIRHGSRRNPPHTWQVLHASRLWKFREKVGYYRLKVQKPLCFNVFMKKNKKPNMKNLKVMNWCISDFN